MMRMYTIFDKAAQEAAPIFEAANDAVAMRQYRHAMRNVPAWEQEDFSLVYVGTFDRKSLEVIAADKPEVILVPLIKDVLEANHAE